MIENVPTQHLQGKTAYRKQDKNGIDISAQANRGKEMQLFNLVASVKSRKEKKKEGSRTCIFILGEDFVG